jgi:hypothetical protein
MAAFLKTTTLGGILFLLPLAVVLMVLGYLLKLAATAAKPIADRPSEKAGAMWPASGLSQCSRPWCWSLFRLAPASSPAPSWDCLTTRC